VCTSTHGDGELPDNIIPLAERLRRETPDLSHLRYGVIALGDQTYKATFCKAGKDMDALFAECGARKLGERLEIDACTQPLPDEEALNWAQEWVTML
jgi:MioC protein